MLELELIYVEQQLLLLQLLITDYLFHCKLNIFQTNTFVLLLK